MFPGQEARYNLFTGPTHFSSSLDGMVCLGERVWSLHNRDGMRCLVERVWGIQKNMFHKLHVQMSCNCKISLFEHHKSQGLVNQPKWKFKSLACHHDPHAFPPPSADKKRIDLQEVGTMIPTVMSGTTASANGMAMIRNHPAQSAACLIHSERLQNHKRGPQINLKDNTTRPTAEELCLNCVASADFKKCPNKAGFQCLICKAHLKLRLTALPTKTVTAVESTVCHWFCYFLHMVSPEKLSKAGKKGVGSHT